MLCFWKPRQKNCVDKHDDGAVVIAMIVGERDGTTGADRRCLPATSGKIQKCSTIYSFQIDKASSLPNFLFDLGLQLDGMCDG